MAKLFLTGASGSIGKEILSMLSERHSIIALSRNPPLSTPKNVSWVKGNLNQLNSIKKELAKCDTLIHLGASVSNTDSQLF
ncbi:MAG: NAD-dependent epimerase/dehydratase family protein, partial [archaeon]